MFSNGGIVVSEVEASVNGLMGVLRWRAQTEGDRDVFRWLSAFGEVEDSETFRGLYEKAQTVSVTLGAISDSGTIAVAVRRSLWFQRVFAGCLLAGRVVVPLPPIMEASGYSVSERFVAILLHCLPRILVVSECDKGLALRLLQEHGLSADCRVVTAEELVTGTASNERYVPNDLDSVAYLQYSSGTTGSPKAIEISHRNLMANMRAVRQYAELFSDAVGVSWLPMEHDMGLVAGMMIAIYSGCLVYGMRPDDFAKHPDRWMKWMSERRATHSIAPNFAYGIAAARCGEQLAASLDLSHLRVVLCGAEPIDSMTLETFGARFARSGLRQTALFPCYGLAEATLFVTGGPVGAGVRKIAVDCDKLAEGELVESASEGATEVVSSGAVEAGSIVRIARFEEDGQGVALDEGSIGEICVAGESVSRGYWGDRVSTLNTFGWEIEGDHERYLRTGDIGGVKDGQLYVTGRIKDMMIVRGKNYFPDDIERSLRRDLPILRGRRFVVFQNAEDLICCFVEEVNEADVSVDVSGLARDGDDEVGSMLRSGIERSVAQRYGLHVADVRVIPAGSLPTTVSGKVVRTGLEDLISRLDIGENDE